MKFDCEEIAPSGRPVLKLRLGAEELEIIRGLVLSGLRFTPIIPATEQMHSRMKAMSRCLNSDAVAQWIKRGDSNSDTTGSIPVGVTTASVN